MKCILRLILVITSIWAVSLTLVRAEPTATGGLPLPEDYYPLLREILDSALKLSPRMIAQNTDEAIAEGNRYIARAGQLPSIAGSYSFYPLDRQQRADLPGTNNVKKVGFNFSISQPLFQWGALRNGTRIGELNLKISQGRTAEAYRALVNEIRAQFLSTIISKASLTRARYNQKLMAEQLALARSKLLKHVIADSDLFPPTIRDEQAALAADQAKDNFETEKTILAKISGWPLLADDQIPDAIPAVKPVSAELQTLLNEFTSQTELNTYALKSLRTSIEIERLNYEITKVRLLPKVSAVAGVSQDQQNYSFANSYKYQVRDSYAGVTVSWLIFDSFTNKHLKVNSLARRRQLDREYQAAVEDQIAALRGSFRQLEFYARNLAILEKLLDSSSNAIRVRKEDLARGLCSDADVAAAQLNFNDTQIDAFWARYKYIVGVTGFRSTILDDPRLANLPASHQ